MPKTSAPSHKVYAVTKSGERSYWSEIGACWPHQDGDGFTVKLDMLPLNNAEIVIRKPKAATDRFTVKEAADGFGGGRRGAI